MVFKVWRLHNLDFRIFILLKEYKENCVSSYRLRTDVRQIGLERFFKIRSRVLRGRSLLLSAIRYDETFAGTNINFPKGAPIV